MNGARGVLPSGSREGGVMISDEKVDAAVRILEDPMAGPYRKQIAREFVDAWLRQEQQTLEWMCHCYRRHYRPFRPASLGNDT